MNTVHNQDSGEFSMHGRFWRFLALHVQPTRPRGIRVSDLAILPFQELMLSD